MKRLLRRTRQRWFLLRPNDRMDGDKFFLLPIVISHGILSDAHGYR